MLASSRSDPTSENPRRLPLINQWLAAYEIEGRYGLEKSFYHWAERCLNGLDSRKLDGWSKGNEKRSWGFLLKDKEQGTHIVASLLGLLPDKIILALLRGELPLKCKEDHEVRRFVSKFMQLDETPGIYVNLLHNHEYRWLSSQDIEALIAKLERYIEVEPSGLPRADQTAVDIRHSNWTPGPNDSKIRWLQGQPGGRPELIIQEWIEKVKDIYCQNPTDVTTAFRMGPAEVGWASNTKARCRQHWNSSSTTYLFGLLNAICRTSRPSGFAFPEPMQLVLFPIWERDEMMCRIGEIVGSMLCSSYWYLGGLNCFHAGTIVWHEEDGTRSEAELRPVSSNKLCWGDNLKIVRERLHFIRSLDEEVLKARRLDDARAQSEASKVVEAEAKDLSSRLENAQKEQKERKDLEAKVKATQSSLELDALEAELDEEIAEMREDKDRWTSDVLLKD